MITNTKYYREIEIVLKCYQNFQGNIKEQERQLSFMVLFCGMSFEVKSVVGPDSFLRIEFETTKKKQFGENSTDNFASFRSDFSSVVLD